MIFLSNFRIEIFLQKNVPFSNLKNVRVKNDRDELGNL